MPNYFQNIITVYPSLNNSLFSSIVLNEKTESTTMMATNGGTIVLKEGNTIEDELMTPQQKKKRQNMESKAILFSEQEKIFRTQLSFKVAEIIKTSFKLLGINVPERM